MKKTRNNSRIGEALTFEKKLSRRSNLSLMARATSPRHRVHAAPTEEAMVLDSDVEHVLS